MMGWGKADTEPKKSYGLLRSSVLRLERNGGQWGVLGSKV